jgi:hypothetical protein
MNFVLRYRVSLGTMGMFVEEGAMKSKTAHTELRDFHRFIGAKLKNGSAHASPEEALEEWRDQHPEGVEFEDDTEAIQEAIDDMLNGDTGRPYKEVMDELRQHIESKIKKR